MPDLSFEVVGVEVPAFAAVPMLAFKLNISNASPTEQIHSVMLRCQLQIAVTRRRYSSQEQAHLLEIFGEPSRWGETLRNLLWTHTSTVVPTFVGSTSVDLTVPCTYDFDVVATKYFDALEEGDIPLTFLFSGTIFYEGMAGNLQVAQISWSKEANFRLPARQWHAMMEHYFPNTAWIRLNKEVFDRLYAYKTRYGLVSWEEALGRLLTAQAGEGQA